MSRATAPKPPSPVSESTLTRARRGERVIVRRGRKPVAAVVSIADLRLLEELEDRFDVGISLGRLADPKEKRIPYSEVRKPASPLPLRRAPLSHFDLKGGYQARYRFRAPAP
jgi:prevent-host-death family protein